MADAKITIIRAGCTDAFGNRLLVGTQYSVEVTYANDLVNQGFATWVGAAVDPTLPNVTNRELWRGAKLADSGVIEGAAPRRVVLFGDSRTAQNNSFNATGAGSVYNNVQGMVTWALARSGQRCSLVANKGVGGNTTLDLLARMTADLDPLGFDWLVLMCGINDVAASIPVATITANYELIYDYARSRGARVIHVADYAPNNALSAGASQNILAIRRYVMGVPSRRADVFAIDSMALLGDSTASPPVMKTIYTLDPGGSGFHFNGAGADLIGEQIAAIWNTYVPAVPGLTTSAADNYGTDATNPNLVDFGLMIGNAGTPSTSATATPAWATLTPYLAGALVTNAGNAYTTAIAGTSGATAPTHTSGTVSDGTVAWRFVGSGALTGVATGWTMARTGGTGTGYVCTIDRVDGVGRTQVLAVTGGNASDTWQMSLTSTIPGRALNGQTFLAEGSAEIINPAGFNAPTMRLLTTVNAVAVQSRDMSASSTLQAAVLRDTGELRIKVAPITLNAFSEQPDWAAGEVVAAGAIRRSAGRAYSTTAGGTCGSTPPTHSTGTVSDGSVLWTATITSLSPQWFMTAGAAGSRFVALLGRTSLTRQN